VPSRVGYTDIALPLKFPRERRTPPPLEGWAGKAPFHPWSPLNFWDTRGLELLLEAAVLNGPRINPLSGGWGVISSSRRRQLPTHGYPIGALRNPPPPPPRIVSFFLPQEELPFPRPVAQTLYRFRAGTFDWFLGTLPLLRGWPPSHRFAIIQFVFFLGTSPCRGPLGVLAVGPSGGPALSAVWLARF